MSASCQIHFNEFRPEHLAADINEVWSWLAIKQRSVQNWFQKFRRRDFWMKDMEGCERHSVVNND